MCLIKENSLFAAGWLVSQIVDHPDISRVTNTCKGGGTGSYRPRMMLKAVLFACLNSICSCRKIENARQDRDNVYMAVGHANAVP